MVFYNPDGTGLRVWTEARGDIMHMGSNGNIGIGTTTPGARLHVNGSVQLQTGSPAAGEFLSATDALGTAGWVANPVPSGAIMFFNGACPAGWSEFTSARGRYIVGVPAGGSVGSTAGTALTNLEQRNNAGVHTHAATVTDPGHSHVNLESPAPGYGEFVWGDPAQRGWRGPLIGDGAWSCVGCIDTNTTGISVGVNPAGTADTNAPYVQLTPCSKN
jgi:hypothetical protein